jgi:hypothetical protein
MGTIKSWAVAAVVAAACNLAYAQFIADDPDWKESEVPAPPAFDLKRLVPVTVPAQSQLKWGVDPATVKIFPDGVIRYVVVAQSSSGTINALYEGIRCNKGEFRRYARYNRDSGWVMLKESDWTSLRATGTSRHPLVLAKEGMCDGAAPPASVSEAMRLLRHGSEIKN